jgi:hypothetical protein
MKQKIKYGINTASDFQLNGFATGGYSKHCCECGKEFTGDKRAMLCLECAIKKAEESLNEIQNLKTEIRNISDTIAIAESCLVVIDSVELKRRLQELSE